MAEYILAHELGTSGDKATLFGTDGKMIGSRTCPYDIYYDQPLWAEQDANAWWNAVCGSTRELLSSYGILGDEVKAISFSGQNDGLPSCRQTGKSFAPCHYLGRSKSTETICTAG